MASNITFSHGVSAFLDERIPKLDMVITGHLNKSLSGSNSLDRSTFDLLLKIHYSLQDYIDKFDL